MKILPFLGSPCAHLNLSASVSGRYRPKNVTSVKRFIQDVIRKTFEKELVFPNFHALGDGTNANIESRASAHVRKPGAGENKDRTAGCGIFDKSNIVIVLNLRKFVSNVQNTVVC